MRRESGGPGCKQGEEGISIYERDISRRQWSISGAEHEGELTMTGKPDERKDEGNRGSGMVQKGGECDEEGERRKYRPRRIGGKWKRGGWNKSVWYTEERGVLNVIGEGHPYTAGVAETLSLRLRVQRGKHIRGKFFSARLGGRVT